MGKTNARNVTILADVRDLTGRTNNTTLGRTAEAPEVTTFGSVAREHLPGGLKTEELRVDGFWDSAASNVDATLSGLVGGSAWFGVYPSGYTASMKGLEFIGILTDYSIPLAVANAATVSFTATGSGPLLEVVSLGSGSLAGTGTSAALASVDQTATGNVGPLQVIYRLLALAGTTPQISGSYQQSANDSAWTTEVDFGAAASTAGTITVSAVTSASRYRRFKYIVSASGTGTGSAAVAIACGSSI